MKLIIQIPCYNEEDSIGITLKGLPRKISGFDRVESLIIDDGSTDDTIKIAKINGVDHVVQFKKNQGLSKAFLAGLDACLNLGADVIVNTDADNQYESKDTERLVQPILDGKADVVIGARPIDSIKHFSSSKKMLQKIGSWAVRVVSKAYIKDAPSGFRAISREAALQLNVFNDFTYTIETIIQAGQKNMAVASVDVRTNDQRRPSRLLKSIPSYIAKSISTIVRIFVVYKPFRFFMTIGCLFFAGGVSIGIRFLYFYVIGDGTGHVQSLILSSILIGIGFQTILVAFLSDLQAVNRRLLEDIQYRVKKSFYNGESFGKRKS